MNEKELDTEIRQIIRERLGLAEDEKLPTIIRKPKAALALNVSAATLDVWTSRKTYPELTTIQTGQYKEYYMTGIIRTMRRKSTCEDAA